jgi:pimeloyl-ACP methyl ester carboxylesterase
MNIRFGAILAIAMFASVTTQWRDPSTHRVRFVTVDGTIRLEVLDWGGSGRPVLFVGCYLTAHVYDNIAPKLTDQFHVYAVTRRGVGASDHPSIGYDPQRRADDIFDVIAALDMRKPILIGNSCGGPILHVLGAQHPDRIGGLMYLDAAEDQTLMPSDYTSTPPVDRAHLPQRVERKTPPLVFPEAETRQLERWPIDAVIRKAITQDNNVRPDYAHIAVPVLAIFRTRTWDDALAEYPPKNDEERAALIQGYASAAAMLSKWESDLRQGVPAAKIVELPGANLYMFISNEADVIRELRGFAASLPRH